MLLETGDVKMDPYDTTDEKDGRYFLAAMALNAVFWFLIVLPWFIFT